MGRTTFPTVAAILILAALASTPASAQLSGANFKGDYGLTSASQPPPGWWLGLYYVAYDTDTVRDKNGDRISFDPSRRGSVALLSARYLFEFGAESTTEGDTFFIGLTFPVGVDLGS